MGFTEKTNYLLETKSLLKDRINSLGGSITSGTTFRDYLVWLDSLYEALEEKTITGLPDSLEGKCEQTGTPTPTSPQPINITTGRQVVSVVGKNRINNANLSYDYSNVSADKNTLTTIDTGIRYTTTSTGSPFIIFKLLNLSKYIGKVIRLKANFGNNGEIRIVRTNNDCSLRQIETQSVVSGNTISYTVPSDLGDKEYLAFGLVVVGGNSSVDFTNLILTIDDSNTTYEEYKGNDYEINLGKNLLNIDGTRTSEGLINTTSGTIISVSGTSSNTYSSLTQQITQNIPIGTYTFSIQETYSKRISFIPTFSDNTTATYHITANQLSTTFTTSKEIKSYRIYMETTSGTTYNMTIKPQLEKGSVASSFSPYKTPIYLGKIGNYQDYIFRNTTENPLYDSNLEEGQWYIHKEIGRVVLNGASGESWNILNVSTKCYKLSNFENGNGTDTQTNYPILSSHFLSTKQALVYNGTIGIQALGGTTKALYICFGSSSSISDVSALRTWLSTHNVEVYYVLNTPTNTLIEDEELINQLNEIDIFTVISEDFYN